MQNKAMTHPSQIEIYFGSLSIFFGTQVSNHFSDIISLLNFTLPGLLVLFSQRQ